ncbi:PAS domain S-box protein [Calidithermus chliarophilus]|uniref:PAS domain S-box protein n=1 Tax=Calidithermus chliarophilus TaxID=52023 RepID=UPI000406FA19|nr:PAS domain S-box protein [Calidithermus chliarophilus]
MKPEQSENPAPAASPLGVEAARLLDAVGQAVIAADPQGRIAHWNAAAQALYGWAAEEVLGRELLGVLPLEPRVLAAALAGESWSGEARLRRKDGSSLRALLRLNPVLDGRGGVAGVVALAQDAREFRQAEEALRDSEERFRSLVEASTDFVFTLAPDGSSPELGAWWSGFTGQDPYTAGGEGWLEAVHPHDRERVRSAWAEAMARHTPYRQEYRLRHRSGQYRRLRMRCLPHFSPEGELREWIGTATDVTERRRAQEHLQRLQRVTASLSQAATPQQVYAAVMSQVEGALGASAGSVYVLEDDQLRLVAATGFAEELLEAYRHVPLTAPVPAADAVRRREPVWLPSQADYAGLYPHLQEQVARLEGEAAASIPLVYEGEVLGGLNFTFRDRLTFDGEDQNFLLAVAAQTAQALERARLLEAERQARERAEKLQRLTAVLSEPLDPASIYERLMGESAALLGARTGTLYLLEGDTLQAVGWTGENALRRHYLSIPLSAPVPAADSAREGVARWLKSKDDYARQYPHLGPQIRQLATEAGVSLPLRAGGHTLGSLAFTFEEEREWGAQERAFLEALASLTAEAIERARLYADERRARHGLEEANALLQTLLESAPLGFAFVDHELRYRYVNAALARLNGLPPEAHLGRSVGELFPEARRTVELLRGVMERSEPVLEMEFVADPSHPVAPGHTFWLSYYPVRAGERVLGVGVFSQDVTERRQAEAAVRASEARYRALVEVGGAAVWRTDAGGELVWANEHFQRLTGLSLETAHGLGWLEAIHPDDRPLALEAWQRSLERLVPYDVELRLRGRDGRYRVVHSKAAPVFGEDGRVQEWMGTDTDITARKLAEAALRESEERFRTMADSSPLMIWVTDPHGRVEFVNRAYAEFFGATAEQIREQGWQPLVHPDDAPAYTQAFLECLREHRPFQAQARVRHASGEWRWIVSYAAPRFVDGEFAGMVGSSPDITEIKRVEDRLRLRVRQQAAVAELSRRALESPDPGTLFQEALQALVQTLEVEYAGVLELLPEGRSLRLCAGVGWREGRVGEVTVSADPDTQPGYTLSVGQPVVVEDLSSEARFHGPPLLLEHGVVSGMAMVIRGIPQPYGVLGVYSASRRAFSRDDVNFLRSVANVLAIYIERHRAEQALRESEERYRRLAEAQKRFVSDAAHELRAPLMAIQGNLQLLLRFEGIDGRERREALSDAAREAERLSRLVNDMLALARGDAGLRLRLGPVRLDRVLGEAFATLKGLGNGHRLELGPLPALTVPGDADRLKQLALQLLENALKYTPAGGTVRLELDPGEGYAEFRVSDTGVGIAPEDLPHVFERFWRADPSRSRDAGGTGLGLSIAQWIVEQHGGRIWLQSELGRGTTAFVRLPLEAPAG